MNLIAVFRLGLILALVWLLAGPVAAQDTATPPPTEGVGTVLDDPAAAEQPGDVAPAPELAPLSLYGITAQTNGPDYIAWNQTAERAEAIVESGRGSAFALQRLRTDIVGWRDKFLSEQSVNSGRIATVQTQIDALGLAPAEGEPPEDSSVTDRRTELHAQKSRLRAPGLLAQEAHAHASGLISEIDSMIREQRRAQLMTRGASPLNPTQWPELWENLSGRVVGLWKEMRVAIRSSARHDVLQENWPSVALYLFLAVILVARAPIVVRRGIDWLSARYPRGANVWDFVLSIGNLAIPVLGLVFLRTALEMSGMFGFRATRLIDVIPSIGLIYFSARWLASRLFDPGRSNPPPFDFKPEDAAILGRLLVNLGVVLAILGLIEAFIDTGDVEPDVRAIVILPLELVMAYFLFRFGKVQVARTANARTEVEAGSSIGIGEKLLSVGGRLMMAAAVIAPILSLLGYGTAASSLLYPAILTLALIALVLLLHWLTYDIYGWITGAGNASRDALIPVLAAVFLTLIAIPFLSLIWGARVDDLNEIWARFREGYSFGDTRISPVELSTFLLVFFVGYMITRFIQAILRSSILPKTRIDIGGQNAIVSGLGYVGIFLAAMAAITATGLDLSNLAIVAGALSVGIGFGLQTIVSNFVSGIILLIERPISEGDWIEVGGRMGYVRDISVRSTRIETFDRTDVIVPNADLVTGQVVNWTRGNPVGRVIVPVSVVYGTDTAKVTAVLQEIAEGHPMVLLAPPPSIMLVNFSADAVNFEIRAIIRDVNFGLTVRSEMNHVIAQRFFDEGIEMAGMARGNTTPGRTAMTEAAAAAAPDVSPSALQLYYASRLAGRADDDDG
jgi:potassium-dependent mechanosensitive channel